MSRDGEPQRDWKLTRLLPGVLAGLASVALLCAALTSAASAAYPGANGKIAFVRDHAIYTIDDNGASLHRLTHRYRCSGPRWSPGGKRIAYICGGDLWIMNADGSDKRQVTGGAPRYTDSRPSWSPNGTYLAFVKTEHGHSYGYLTRYDTVTHHEVTFSTPDNSERPTAIQIKAAALPAPVAWGWAYDAGTDSELGSFILFEGAHTGDFCQPHQYCLDAFGRPHQSWYRNGFLSGEDGGPATTRYVDPDWFPNSPQFDTDVLTTQESCGSAGCTPQGIDLQIGSGPVHPGAYQAVYSPDGTEIAYVDRHDGAATIYTATINPRLPDIGTALTTGTQPDWQPLPQR